MTRREPLVQPTRPLPALMVSLRRERLPPLVDIKCAGCGAVLATARAGTEAYCKRCRRWSGAGDDGKEDRRCRPFVAASA